MKFISKGVKIPQFGLRMETFGTHAVPFKHLQSIFSVRNEICLLSIIIRFYISDHTKRACTLKAQSRNSFNGIFLPQVLKFRIFTKCHEASEHHNLTFSSSAEVITYRCPRKIFLSRWASLRSKQYLRLVLIPNRRNCLSITWRRPYLLRDLPKPNAS